MSVNSSLAREAAPGGRWGGMSKPPGFPEDLLIALARQRGLTLDAERAAALRPLAESLLGRLARIGKMLPLDAAPPPPGSLEDRAP